MRREPLLLPAVSIAGGIVLAHFYYFQLFDLALPAAILAALLLLSMAPSARYQIRTISWCVCFALAGIVAQVTNRLGPAPLINAEDGESVLLTGCVTDPPVFSPGREQFTLHLAPRSAARLTLNLKDEDHLAMEYGQRWEVAAKIRQPRDFQNPDAFDYAGYLAEQHIYWLGSVTSLASARLLPGHCGNLGLAGLFRIRTWALNRLTALYPDDPHTAALLKATLLGETSGVEKRWTSDFRITGTYHALVISGQHVSVLAFTILLILRLFRLRRVQALCVAAVASWLYAFISGMSSPVMRAAAGFTLLLIAHYCFRRLRILNTLAAVAIGYLLVVPDQLFAASFQLSFLSAAAIAAFAIPFMENTTEPVRAGLVRFDQHKFDPQLETAAAVWRVELRQLAATINACTRLPLPHSQALVCRVAKIVLFAMDAVIVSACVQFGLALPMISYFHRLSITGLSANVLIIPLLSLVVPLGFASILTGLPPLAALTKYLLIGAENIAAWHAAFEPWPRLAAIPLLYACAFAALLILLAVCLRLRRPWWSGASLAAAQALFILLCIQPWPPLLAPGKLELSAIDVGQGDSLFVAFPDGETMLVDAGGFPGMERMKRRPQLDMGEDVVSPYLWSRRIRHLDYVVLTHGHSDHMAGLAAILDNFHPRQLWIGAEPETPAWRTITAHARQDGVRIVPLTRASDLRRLGESTIRFLSPAPGYLPDSLPQNNDSLVFEITYRRRSVLLMGDAERPVEADLAASGLLHPVTLLKVGHHGSKTSSSEELLSQIQPRFAFISDGYRNQFHHPHSTVLQRLTEHHTGVFRTDENGLCSFLTDGDKVELKTFR